MLGKKGRWERNERAICLFFCLKSKAGKAAKERSDWSIRSGVDAQPNVICSYNGFDWPAMWEPINIHFSGSLRPPPSLSIYFSLTSTSFLFAFNLSGSAWLECSVVLQSICFLYNENRLFLWWIWVCTLTTSQLTGKVLRTLANVLARFSETKILNKHNGYSNINRMFI